ncbi:MAG: putative sulfate exporter family transporter [Bacteroidetes bacterium]|nr:putative sulfate exporter family transporter [Bacteroidota bacterium]
MSVNKTIQLSEDWIVVLLGGLSIVFILLGLNLPLPVYNWSGGAELSSKLLTTDNLLALLYQLLFVLGVSAIGFLLSGKSLKHLFFGFPVLYLLTIFATFIAGSAQVRSLNLEAVIISLTVGLLISNFLKVPEWLKAVLSTELYVKIGLILLGTGVIFGDILKAGTLGLIQALAVVVSVWYFAYWISTKLKIDEELKMMLASAVSICGVSAAIATSGAIKGDSKKLSYVISLVLITAIPMMIGMPYLAQYLGLSQAETGAWLGGTIDTTGAVVASGTLVGEEALKISTIVKFSQNVLLGIAAFVISIYWSYTKKQDSPEAQLKPSLSVIWDRFPKFVLGFIGVSLLFSFVVQPEVISDVKGTFKNLQTLWFTLAFTSIGLETKFSELFYKGNKKPLYAFLLAQLFNVLVTLAIAYVLF